MKIENLSVKEQIVKPVVKSGNGGAVWVPKDWLGEEVIVIRPEKQKLEPREMVLHLLEPYLKDIVSVGICGSYARKEQTRESDIDALIITKDKRLKLNLKNYGVDATVIPLDKIREIIKKYPVVYYQMIKEAEPLINSYVLDEIKGIKINKSSFETYLKETEEHIKSNTELLELDKLDSIYLKSYSVLYSTVLRLRGLFIIRCILRNIIFSNKQFKKWLIVEGITVQEYDNAFKIYRLVRDDKPDKKVKISVDVVEKFLNLLRKELNYARLQIHGKQKKAS